MAGTGRWVTSLGAASGSNRTLDTFRRCAALSASVASEDMQAFWAKARAARVSVTRGDEPEDYFTAEVDRAYIEAHAPLA